MDTVQSYALNLRNVVITELWHYSFYFQRIFSTRQNTLFLYPGRPTHILVIYRRVSALGQAACSPWWSYLNRKKCLQFFLERLVFSRQHTGIAISPKRYLFVENCLSQESWSYMIPLYFRFKTVYTLLNLYSFAEIPVIHLFTKCYILRITKAGYLSVKLCSTNSLCREFSLVLRDLIFARFPNRGIYWSRLGNLTRKAFIGSGSNSATPCVPIKLYKFYSHTSSNFWLKRDFLGDPPGASHHPCHFYKNNEGRPYCTATSVRTQGSKDPLRTQHHQEEDDDCPRD